MTTAKLLDCVLLEHDLPDHQLRRGALGAVVEVYPPDGYEVEFVDERNGKTVAIVKLGPSEFRRPDYTLAASVPVRFPSEDTIAPSRRSAPVEYASASVVPDGESCTTLRAA